MGLLDSFNITDSDIAKLTGSNAMDPMKMGLLSAAFAGLANSGPSSMPKPLGATIGQAGQAGLLGYGQALGQEKQDILTKMTLMKMAKEVSGLNALQNFGKPPAPAGNPMAPGPGASVMAGSGSTVPSAPAAPQGGQVPDFEGLLAAGVAPETVKALMESWKLRNPDMQVNNGYAYNPRTVSPGFLPQVQVTPQGQAVGLTPGPNGGMPSVSALAGSLPTFSGFQDASEEAKAKRDVITVKVNGQDVQMTREQAAQRFGTGQQPAQPQPKPAQQPQALPALPPTLPPPTQRTTLSGFGVDKPAAQKKFEEASADTAAKYRAGINERVSTGQDLMMRINESEKLLKDFQAGGGEGVRVSLAQTAQAVGAPQNIVDGIARGDLGSAQAFQKIVVSQAMESLKQAMATSGGAGAGRITQAEFQIFQKANPNLELDPRALNKIYDFAKKVHSRDFAEQQGFQRWIDSGKDPAAFLPSYAAQREQQLKTDDLKAIAGTTGQGLPQGVRVTRIK